MRFEHGGLQRGPGQAIFDMFVGANESGLGGWQINGGLPMEVRALATEL